MNFTAIKQRAARTIRGEARAMLSALYLTLISLPPTLAFVYVLSIFFPGKCN